LRDCTGENVRGLVERVVAPDATVVSDGLASYLKLGEHRHVGKTVGSMAAHILLPWVHRVFANLKRAGSPARFMARANSTSSAICREKAVPEVKAGQHVEAGLARPAPL
jgi:hypothetical protein